MSEASDKRAYTAPARQARAAATRARILAAAAELFLAEGYARTSTSAVAKAAGTSEASVFSVFGSKAELLVAVVADHVGRDADFPLQGNPVWQKWKTERSPASAAAAIAEFARVTRRAHERSWRLFAVVAGAKEADATVAGAAARGARRRHADCLWFATEVIGVTPAHAESTADAVWALISVENYRSLVIDRAWSPAQYEAWLATLLHTTLTTNPQ